MVEKIPGIEFKIHEDEDSVQVRITKATNGFILKAGRKPFLCRDQDAVHSAVSDVVNGYFDWLETQK